MDTVGSVELEGTFVKLEPLGLAHLDGLCEVGLDDDLWRWTTTSALTRDAMRRYIEIALTWQAAGTAIPFATVERKTARVIGSTRFANIDAANRKLEIGWTWVARPWQRTAVNTEAKLLMLTHAFEKLDCLRVEFKTDALNERSRRALRRIGATEEGTLRKHLITESGRERDSVYFSILDSEWSVVKARLVERLQNSQTAG
ncbi:MAG: GNAT family N-acetyltransferase [Anaerolineae bacterium]|nr:GNAT family N-acetyltransferase [Gemmatimonadaceae bacterium]